MLLRSPATQDSEGKEGKEIGLARSPGPRGAQNGEACTHLPARAALSPREGRSEGEIISVPILSSTCVAEFFVSGWQKY